jgi:DNA-binding LacI/PurR family transcriptional regulator
MREEYERAGIADGIKVCVFASGEEQSGQVRRWMPATNWDADDYVAALRARRHAQGDNAGAPTEQMLTRLRWQLSDFRREQELRKYLVPHLGQALASRDTTAWVGANDDVALQCLDYLQLADCRVPEAISVLGFDNSPESTVRGLTTYNINAGAFVHAMVNHVLDPRLDPWDPLRDPPVEIEGYVTERATTASRGSL